MCTCAHVWSCVSVCVCVCPNKCVHVSACIHVCRYKRECVYVSWITVCACVHACIHTRVYVCVCTRMWLAACQSSGRLFLWQAASHEASGQVAGLWQGHLLLLNPRGLCPLEADYLPETEEGSSACVGWTGRQGGAGTPGAKQEGAHSWSPVWPLSGHPALDLVQQPGVGHDRGWMTISGLRSWLPS